MLLTTLHTNSAAGAIARLLDMGVEPYLLASVLRGVLGQRLVGVLCPACKHDRPATVDEAAFFIQAGMEVPTDLRLWEAPGCEACESLGFVSRVGIFEFLEVNERIRDSLNESGRIYLTHTKLAGRITLRFCVGQTHTRREHVERAWQLVREAAGRAG